MITYPATRETVNAELDLQRRGVCRSCGQESEWYQTAGGRWVLLSVVKNQPYGAPVLLELHNEICPQGPYWKAEGKVEEVLRGKE
jgi:hypothetical protein